MRQLAQNIPDKIQNLYLKHEIKTAKTTNFDIVTSDISTIRNKSKLTGKCKFSLSLVVSNFCF